MTINIETAIAWMREREGQVYYSMEYRDGPDSYDCSSSVYYALRNAGAVSAGWAVNTEYEHDWLIKNGYELIAENQEWNAQRGDIFIYGRRGYSAGAGGHTGMFVDSDNIIHCNYARNGITVNNHDAIWNAAGQPYFYAYRLTNPDAQPEEVKKAGKRMTMAIGTLELMVHILRMNLKRLTVLGTTLMRAGICFLTNGNNALMVHGTTLISQAKWPLTGIRLLISGIISVEMALWLKDGLNTTTSGITLMQLMAI